MPALNSPTGDIPYPSIDPRYQIILDLTDRVTELENKIVELGKRIDWMENYDKKNSNNPTNDAPF
jgi:hypothetical protein